MALVLNNRFFYIFQEFKPNSQMIFPLICKLHIWRSIRAMTYRRMLYILAIIKRNHFEVIMCACFSHDTKLKWLKYILKWFRFIIAKIYNILRYVIPLILRHMCNLHTKETVILSVLSNKTNLILGFSSLLKCLWSEKFVSGSEQKTLAGTFTDNFK